VTVRVKWVAGLLLAGLIIWALYAVFWSKPKVAHRYAGEGAGVGVSAPDFVLKDIKGKDIRLSRYRGRVVLLVFMTTWCSYCRADIPYLKDLHARYGPKGLVIFHVDIQEPREKAAAYAARHSLPFNTLVDFEGDVMQRYGVRGVPFRTLIDREGRIICLNCRALESQLTAHLGELPREGG